MSRREYFIDLGEDVVERFDKLIESGKTPDQASNAILAEEYIKLNKDLTRFKRKAGLSLNGNAEELRKMKDYAGKNS